MDKQLLKKILSIPSFSRKEECVRAYLIEFANQRGIKYSVDTYGNVFLRKGVISGDQSYPCVVGHMDTVYSSQAEMVDKETKLDIIEKETKEGTILYAQTSRISGVPLSAGIGGDDKAGLFICLSLIDRFDTIMGAFFVEEEIGCNGSRKAKYGVGHTYLEQAGYFIQFDAPTNDWISRTCSGVELFNNNFEKRLNPVWDKHKLSTPKVNDPFTDVKELRLAYPVCCINYFAGYMDMHSLVEYVVIEYVEKAFKVGVDTILELGLGKYLYSD